MAGSGSRSGRVPQLGHTCSNSEVLPVRSGHSGADSHPGIASPFWRERHERRAIACLPAGQARCNCRSSMTLRSSTASTSEYRT